MDRRARLLIGALAVLAGCTQALPVDGTRDAGVHVHAPGILDTSSPDFHATLLRSRNYDFAFCQSCHGENYDGGTAKSSCLTCHAQKPDQCVTCHGPNGPRSGAHTVHTQLGPLGKGYACSECHRTPTIWSAPDHILQADGQLDPPPAEVSFGETAQLPPYPRSEVPRRQADYLNGTCSQVYCHQPNPDDAAATHSAPQWWNDHTARSCSTCHGQPPSSHYAGDCVACHRAVVDAAGQLVSTALHLDGVVALGDDSGTCTACHSMLNGAHTSHLAPPHGLANPIACTECHLVPSSVLSPGHLSMTTTAASVFPVGGIGPVAAAYGAMPSFASSNRTCSDIACHGSGTKLARDTSATIERSPLWAIPAPGTGPSTCGACHGLPPSDGVHDPNWRLQQCAGCHAASIDSTGSIRFVDGKTTHADGHVDVP